MEAPKKIYIDEPTGEFNDHWSIYQNNDSIEYIRKDVFIEKSCELLSRMIWEVIEEDFEVNEFIEDFKKYLKGDSV